MIEKAYLVSVWNEKKSRYLTAQDLSAELSELASACGLEVVGAACYKESQINAYTFLGKGKIEAIRLECKKLGANLVVFDFELTGSQQRNVEDILNLKSIDRTQLILDIFAQRAKSQEGKVQVELAQLKYLLPRLGGQGVYLSRLGGGVGTRGPGEQKLEMDRRRIRERIDKLKQELRNLSDARLTAIEKKKSSDWPVIALAGYTNAGKSTLFNCLTQSNQLSKNQLFSTLDTKTSHMPLRDGLDALVVDTVGFVRNLPHDLVESFKATLQEAIYADLVIHVMDAGRNDIKNVQESVDVILDELGVETAKRIMVFNKSDTETAKSQKASLMMMYPECQSFFISAKTYEGVEAFQAYLKEHFLKSRLESSFLIPYQKLGALGWIYDRMKILEKKELKSGVRFKVLATPKDLGLALKALGIAST